MNYEAACAAARSSDWEALRYAIASGSGLALPGGGWCQPWSSIYIDHWVAEATGQPNPTIQDGSPECDELLRRHYPVTMAAA